MSDTILYNIYNISNNCYISNDKYFIDCYFYLDNNYMKALSELKIKLEQIGCIYGEINPEEYVGVKLPKLSHSIININGGLIELRKLKLKKLDGYIITNPHNIKITIKILNTQIGKIIRNIMDNDINNKFKTYLHCAKKIENNEILKIFTLNIEA